MPRPLPPTTSSSRGPERGSPRAFALGFALALFLTVAPLLAFTARAVALGEVDLFDTPGSLSAEIVHGTLVEHLAEYKLAMTRALRPEVLAIGSSRVMKWRDLFFDGCGGRRDCFYNAGGSMATLREAEEFVRDVLRVYTPRVLLIDVAEWHLDPNFTDNTHRPVDLDPPLGARVERAVNDVRELARMTLTEPDLQATLLGRVTAPAGYRGVRAIAKGAGFERDGSRREYDEYLAQLLATSPSDRTKEIVDRVYGRADGAYRFASFEAADPASLQELDAILSMADAHGVKVIGFISPYADDVADAIEAQPRISFGYADVDARLRDLFAAHNAPFFRFRRMSEIGCPPGEALDGYHITEVCNARMLERILADPRAASVLVPYASVAHVRDIITHRANDILLVPR